MRDSITVKGADLSVVAAAAVDKIYDKMASISGPIVLSFPGGRSMQATLTKFASQASTFSYWDRVYIFCSDERLVPLSDEQSNYQAVKQVIDSLVVAGLPKDHVQWFDGSTTNLSEALTAYDQKLAHVGENIHIPFLGVGEDGHIASLFPNSAQLQAKEKHFLHITDAPKLPSQRVSLSPMHIEQADLPVLFFVGETKKTAYKQFLDPDISEEQCPAKIAKKGTGSLLIITDIDVSSL